MEITWHGQYCFRMTERGTLTVVTDPFDASTGEEPPKLRADVVTITRDDPAHNNISAVVGAQRGDVRIVRGPGEYEMGGVFITGVSMKSETKKGAAGERGTVYTFNFDGLTVVHLGGLSFVPSQAQVEALETVDVLLVPVGGGDGLNAAQASEIISLIEPSIVVPMNYRVGAEGGRKLDSATKFLKEMGLSEAKTQDALKVTKSTLPEDTQVILLEVR
ncbi:MAG: MBL fold metallo-hydrolase [Chloroflexi bacterium]|nr:MBL fold metallo-hydrolase [Chloroflexota bacterium]MCL5274974.1 MBL fold metallo-hydrolase [Chloroflexota bacterium]